MCIIINYTGVSMWAPLPPGEVTVGPAAAPDQQYLPVER